MLHGSLSGLPTLQRQWPPCPRRLPSQKPTRAPRRPPQVVTTEQTHPDLRLLTMADYDSFLAEAGSSLAVVDFYTGEPPLPRLRHFPRHGFQFSFVSKTLC